MILSSFLIIYIINIYFKTSIKIWDNRFCKWSFGDLSYGNWCLAR